MTESTLEEPVLLPPDPAGVIRLLQARGVTKRDLERFLERRNFRRWLGKVSPDWSWDWAHLAYIRTFLDKVTTGEITRLIIATQPQVGKSQQNTVRYPAWRMERHPNLRQAIACYDQKHAKRFSRQIRVIARKRKIPLSKERRATEEWETKAGGFIRAIGVGTGITGTPLDLLHIDDPIRGFEEANSVAYRERLWGWFAEDLMTRLQKDGACIITMTPWHSDDLIGRIMNSPSAKRWTFIKLPAEAEEDDPLGREIGEPLCPSRFGKAELEERKEVLGLGYFGLYQCRPVPRGGALFKSEWLDQSMVLPQAVPIMTSVVRYWDLAASLKGDWTVGLLMGVAENGLYYILDIVRGRWLPPERDAVIVATAEQDSDLVRVAFGRDPGQAGVDQASAIVRKLAGYSAAGYRETGDKVTRADAFASQLGAGNVRIVQAAWTAAYRTELLSFPGGKHDDMCDSSSGAFARLATKRSVYEDRDVLILGSGAREPLALEAASLMDDRFWE